jgi:hypothetical protein
VKMGVERQQLRQVVVRERAHVERWMWAHWASLCRPVQGLKD